MENKEIQLMIEGLLLASKTPLTISNIRKVFEPEQKLRADVIKQHLQKIQDEWAEKGLELRETAIGWRFQTKPVLQSYLDRLSPEKPMKYSRALLEVLAIIVWKQPVTRGDIENIRGVSVSSHMIRTLEERQWIEVVGYRDVLGKPALFATTDTFLSDLGLKSLDELPDLTQVEALLTVDEFGKH